MDASDVTVVGFARKTNRAGFLLLVLVAMLACAVGIQLGGHLFFWTVASMAAATAMFLLAQGGKVRKLRADEHGLSVDGILVTSRIDLDDAFVVEQDHSADESAAAQPVSYLLQVRGWNKSSTYSFVDLRDATRIADSLRAVVEPLERAEIGAGLSKANVRVSDREVAYKRFGRVRKLDIADIARWSITRTAKWRALLLRLKDGRRVSFREETGLGNRRRDRTAIDRISLALERAGIRSMLEPSEDHERYRRRARSVSQWLDELQSVARSIARGGSFREAATPQESLWRIVQDIDAPDDARIGAAVALRIAGDEVVRIRIAEEAARTASSEVSAALESLGNGESDFANVLARAKDD